MSIEYFFYRSEKNDGCFFLLKGILWRKLNIIVLYSISVRMEVNFIVQRASIIPSGYPWESDIHFAYLNTDY